MNTNTIYFLLWKLINNTPFYIYLIFAYFIYIILTNKNEWQTSLIKLFILAIIFFILSKKTLNYYFEQYPFSIMIWLGSILAGGVIGWVYFKREPIKVNKERKKIYIPYFKSILFIFMVDFLIFILIKYYLIVSELMDICITQEMYFINILNALSAFGTGLYFGGFFNWIKQYRNFNNSYQ